LEYIYDTYARHSFDAAPRRVDTTTNYDEALLRADALQAKGEYAFTMVTDGLNTSHNWVLDTEDSWEGWRTSLERAHSWKAKVETAIPVSGFVDDVIDKAFDLHTQHYQNELELKCVPPHPENDNKHDPRSSSNQHQKIFGMTPIDPPHYQGFVDDYQWLETMCRIPRYRNDPDSFIAAIELQVRKYLDRNGKKDNSLQELEKGLWYYKFMVAYIKNGKTPIFVKDVNDILER